MVKLASIISMNHKHVAAKISFTKMGQYAIEEARNMVRLDDPNITKIFGVTMLYQTQLTTLDVVVLLELADSDLSSIIKPSSSLPLTIHNIKHFSIQIASSLKYLLEKKMRHLDLKPGNILFFKNKFEGTLKLTDFGSIVETENEAIIEKDFVAGTKMYLPPEHDAAKDNDILIPVSFSFDIFGFGVILMEMLVKDEEIRKKKFEEIKTKKEALKMGEIKLLESNESCIEDSLWREDATNDENGKKLIEICKKCLMINPLERYHDGGQLLNALEELAED
jgi:serine/threonine protein kinase